MEGEKEEKWSKKNDITNTIKIEERWNTRMEEEIMKNCSYKIIKKEKKGKKRIMRGTDKNELRKARTVENRNKRNTGWEEKGFQLW